MATLARSSPARGPSPRRRRAWVGWQFTAPFLAVFALVFLAPIGYGVYLSGFSTKLIGGTTFVGVDNYTKALSDPQFWSSFGRVAGGKPYTVDGTKVGVNFADAGTQKFTALWQKLIDGKLLSPVTGWSDGWYKGLGDGTIASLVIGAWMPANLESGVKAGNGKWRVAPMPQWAAGGKATSENGGSSLAVPQASGNKTLAYAFSKYATVGEGAQSRADNGAFPATTAQLDAAAFKNKEFPYFGGQKVNEVLAQSAGQVVTGWTYLPFQVYANSVFNDTAGKAYLGSGVTLQNGLKAWQDSSVKYGKEQGFTVS